MNLLISLRSELLKTKRTATIYFTVIAAAVIPLLSLLEVSLDGLSTDAVEDPLTHIISQRFGFLGVALFPLFIMLVCTLLAQIEYRNNTWKQVFTSPQSATNIFFARFLTLHAVLLLFMLLYNIFTVLTLVAIHYMEPAVHLLNRPFPWGALATRNVNAYVALLAMSTIQFVLALKIRNFIVPLAVGLVMWMLGVMVMEYKVTGSQYFPYAFSVYSYSPKYKALIPSVQVWSLGWMVAVLGVGRMWFGKGR